MVLSNFIVLEEGKPAVMHFTDHEIQPRAIRDSLTGRAKTINVLVFQVDELNGRAVSSEFSITAERAATNFTSFLEDKSYRDYLWTFTARGSSFQKEFEVIKTPLKRG